MRPVRLARFQEPTRKAGGEQRSTPAVGDRDGPIGGLVLTKCSTSDAADRILVPGARPELEPMRYFSPALPLRWNARPALSPTEAARIQEKGYAGLSVKAV